MSSEFAKAKINLTLEVMGKRRDGYHELNSLVVFASVGDHLSFEKSDQEDLIVSGPFACGLEGENLILKAARFITSRYPEVGSGVFSLEKNLPVASGIGGGSADAAAAIRLLSDQMSGGLASLDYSEISKALGADIPVCLEQIPVIMSGIGEMLQPVSSMAKLTCVLVNPGSPVSTGEIFRRLNAPLIDGGLGSDRDVPDLSSIDKVLGYMEQHGNDLQVVAESIEPVITDVIKQLEHQDGCLIARMSGSGATCFGIFSDSTQAEEAVADISKRYTHWWVKSCILS